MHRPPITSTAANVNAPFSGPVKCLMFKASTGYLFPIMSATFPALSLLRQGIKSATIVA